MDSKSKRFRLDNIDFKKIGKGAMLNIVGGLAAYIALVVSSPEIEEASGDFYIILTAVATWVTDVLRRFYKDNKTKYNVDTPFSKN